MNILDMVISKCPWCFYMLGAHVSVVISKGDQDVGPSC